MPNNSLCSCAEHVHPRLRFGCIECAHDSGSFKPAASCKHMPLNEPTPTSTVEALQGLHPSCTFAVKECHRSCGLGSTSAGREVWDKMSEASHSKTGRPRHSASPQQSRTHVQSVYRTPVRVRPQKSVHACSPDCLVQSAW